MSGLQLLESKNVRKLTLEEMDRIDPTFISDSQRHITCFLVEKGKTAELSLTLNGGSNDIFIIVDASATLTYLRYAASSCCHSDCIRIMDNARVLTRFTQNEDSEVSFTQKAILGKNALLKSGAYWRASGAALSTTLLAREYASAEHVEICSLRDSHTLKLDTRIIHAAKTRSEVLMKGVVRDGATACLNGNIKIGKQSSKVTAHMRQQLLLLSKGAHGEARPFLEIENNDVQCSHSTSVKEIDREKVFYLMSRGLSEEEAKQVLLSGFLESAMEQMKTGV